MYQGPCENMLEFFQFMGFKCPERKGVADFLQEVMSRNLLKCFSHFILSETRG